MNFPVLKSTIAYARAARGRSRQGDRLQPDHQRHAAAAGRDRVPRRRARRRDHLDRRPARRCRTSSASSTTARAATTVAAPKIKALLARHSVASDRRARHADPADAGRAADLSAPRRRDGLLGSRLRAGDDRAGARLRDRRRRLRSPARRSSASSAGTSCRRRSRIGITASRTSARRCRRFIRATPRRIRAAPASACWACRPTATSRCATASPAPTRTASASVTRRRRSWEKQQAFLESHHINEQDRLPDLLGAADLRRRLLSRGPHPLRHRPTRPNLHYCEWIRGWTHTCLEIYGEMAVKNPGVPAAVR